MLEEKLFSPLQYHSDSRIIIFNIIILHLLNLWPINDTEQLWMKDLRSQGPYIVAASGVSNPYSPHYSASILTNWPPCPYASAQLL